MNDGDSSTAGQIGPGTREWLEEWGCIGPYQETEEYTDGFKAYPEKSSDDCPHKPRRPMADVTGHINPKAQESFERGTINRKRWLEGYLDAGRLAGTINCSDDQYQRIVDSLTPELKAYAENPTSAVEGKPTASNAPGDTSPGVQPPGPNVPAAVGSDLEGEAADAEVPGSGAAKKKPRRVRGPTWVENRTSIAAQRISEARELLESEDIEAAALRSTGTDDAYEFVMAGLKKITQKIKNW